jgi:hypothetical protein
MQQCVEFARNGDFFIKIFTKYIICVTIRFKMQGAASGTQKADLPAMPARDQHEAENCILSKGDKQSCGSKWGQINGV